MRGKIIVVEGLDRAGKTSQCERLVATLKARDLAVVEQKFPDRTTEIGGLLNTFLTSEQLKLSNEAVHLLFSANRWEVKPKLEALLAQGAVIVVDRYTYSGAAFSAANGLDLEWCEAPDRGLPVPDLVIFLDIDEETASRRGGYGEERYESQQMQAKVRTQFQRMRKPSWAWILASGTPDEVFAQVLRAVESIL